MSILEFLGITKEELEAAKANAPEVQVRPAPPAPGTILIRRLAGRCTDGAERGHGVKWHAVPAGDWKALCGAKPGRRSAGWVEGSPVAPEGYRGDSITCAQCAKRSAQ